MVACCHTHWFGSAAMPVAALRFQAVPDAVAPLAAAVSKVKLDDEDHDDWEDRA